jgi:hypothetical protein
MDHLTNDQFSDLLIGAPGRDCELHLAECAYCRAELEKFSASVGLFSSTSLAWSETRPAAAAQAASRWQNMRWAYAPVGWALAVSVAIMVGVPAWRADHPAPAPYSAVNSPASIEDSPADIARDNALLESVNVALNTNEDSPLPEYRLAGGSRSDARAR